MKLQYAFIYGMTLFKHNVRIMHMGNSRIAQEIFNELMSCICMHARHKEMSL